LGFAFVQQDGTVLSLVSTFLSASRLIYTSLYEASSARWIFAISLFHVTYIDDLFLPSISASKTSTRLPLHSSVPVLASMGENQFMSIKLPRQGIKKKGTESETETE